MIKTRLNHDMTNTSCSDVLTVEGFVEMEFRNRDYRAEEALCTLAREPVLQHPLSSPSSRHDQNGILATRVMSKPTSASPLEFDDAGSAQGTFVDPLRHYVPESPSSVQKNPGKHLNGTTLQGASDEAVEAAAREWDAYKMLMMQKFACSNTITVSTTSGIISKNIRARGKSLTTVHLEELDDPEKNAEEEVKIISQQEYVMRLRELNDEITQAWQHDERVTALRLSIKVARLLSDTSVPQFYPTLFILVTDVMDTLGSLVWKRIKRKAEFDDDGNLIRLLPGDFTSNDVRREAKDTCNNWFYKIGSIRELLPRIYLEMAISRCWHFLHENPLNVFQRLTMMIRGLADPLQSAFAHLYLARCAQASVPSEIDFLITGLNDYIALFQRFLLGKLDNNRIKSSSDKTMYVRLVEPAIEWITKCIFKHADKDKMLRLLKDFGLQQKEWRPTQNIRPISVVVHYILKQLPATIVSSHPLELLKLIENTTDLSMAQYMNYRLLGLKLCECNPPRELHLAILNDVLEVVTEYSDLNEYLTVVDVYVDYILGSCVENELNMIIDDISDHIKRAGVTDAELASLESIILKLISNFTNLTDVLSLDHFVDILDSLFGSTRISVYKHILSHISRNNQIVLDPVTRQFLFEISKGLHDSIDSLSSEDDCRQITHLVSRFVQLVDFGGDLEQHLSFLIDCRATFGSMDLLKETLTHSSNYLAARTSKVLRGSHLRHVTDFVKACISFNEVTIPSIKSMLKRVNLYLETAEVALQNSLLSHTEGLIKTTINCLQEIQSGEDLKSTEDEERILSLIRKLSGFLIVVPGHPELGAFYLLKGLFTALESQPWLTPGLRSIQVLCAMVSLTAALAQKVLPYHIKNEEVVSNDELYFGDPSYNEELMTITNILVQKILDSLNQAPNANARGNQALDACNSFLLSFKASGKVAEHCINLIRIAETSLHTNAKYLQLTTTFLEKCSITLHPHTSAKFNTTDSWKI